MGKADNPSKYVWRYSSIDKSTRVLCSEDGSKICAVYTLFGSWYVNLIFLGGSHTLLEGEINSMAEAEHAAVQYIYDLCADEIDRHNRILERLPI